MTAVNPLADAVGRNDHVTAERLLKEGHDVNRKNATGFTPLMIASGLGNPQMVELLLTAGADPTMVDTRMGATALHKAAQSGVVDVAKLLVQQGAFIDAQAPTLGNTPLIDAAWHKNPEMVEYLLDQGARLEIHNRSGKTARWFAEEDLKRHTPQAKEILKLLDDRQARDNDAIDSQKLMTAVLRKDLAEVQKLIDARTQLDEKSPLINENGYAGYTPLLVACLQEGCGDIVKAFLEAGANPRIVDDMIKATPGHKAGYQGRPDAVRELVKDGRFELDAQGPYNGYTALHDAIWHGHTETVKVFLEAGARVDLKTHTGHTPLELAKLYDYSEIETLIRNFLKKGAIMFGILFRAKAKPGKYQELIDFLKGDGEVSIKNEPGTRRFEICPDPNDKDALYVYEAYRDENAFKEHQKNEPYRHWESVIRPGLEEFCVLFKSDAVWSPVD